MSKSIIKDDSFRSKTIAQIDAELEQEYIAHTNRKKRIIIISIILIFLLIPDAFLYWFRFATPHFAKYTTRETINVNQPPVQTYIDETDSDRFITYRTLENRGTYKLEKIAGYSISGKVLATNYYFWGNYIPGGDRPLQSIMLFDIGIGWGKLANERILKSYRFFSTKNYKGRVLTPHLRRGEKNPPMTFEEAHPYYSHTHVIPASPSIMYALIYARRYQPIKMDGYLVKILLDGESADSSTNRDDYGCEIMYVNSVQVGRNIYQ